MDSRKNHRTDSLQRWHVLRQTHRESSFPAVTSLEFDQGIPSREKTFVSQTSLSQPKLKPRSGGRRGHRHQQSPLKKRDQSPAVYKNNDEHVTCSSHIYTFHRGLVPSRDAYSLEVLHTQHFLPHVVADRLANVSLEQRNYRLVFPLYQCL